MNEIFKKECEELGIPFEEFPWDFAEGSPISYPHVFEAMMWILKKRQDKQGRIFYLGQHQLGVA